MFRASLHRMMMLSINHRYLPVRVVHFIRRILRTYSHLVITRPRVHSISFIGRPVPASILPIHERYDWFIRTKPGSRCGPRLLESWARMKNSQDNACNSNHTALDRHETHFVAPKFTPQQFVGWLIIILVVVLDDAEAGNTVARAYKNA